MASLQSYVVRFFYRRLQLSGKDDVEMMALRGRIDRLARLNPAHRRVSVSRAAVGGVPGEWHRPAGAPADRAILYLHGGAWVLGSSASHRALVSRLAYLSHSPALALDYRLAPEHPFPAALEDCEAAFDALVDGGIHPGKIVVAGDSAGGNLALSLLVRLRERGGPLPGAAVGISAATDLSGSGDSYQSRASVDPLFGGGLGESIVRWYAAGHPADDPRISPLYADLVGLPPILLHVGDHEILLDDSTRFAEKARAAGVYARVVVWPEMFHVFHIFTPFLPEARAANREIAEFIRRHQAEEGIAAGR